jgi:hypothetical protein
MNISIKILSIEGQIVSEQTFRYATLKKIKRISIPFGEYTIILEVTGEK